MCIIDCLSTIVFILPLHLDYTKVIILILWWRNFQLEYWRNFQLVSTPSPSGEPTTTEAKRVVIVGYIWASPVSHPTTTEYRSKPRSALPDLPSLCRSSLAAIRAVLCLAVASCTVLAGCHVAAVYDMPIYGCVRHEHIGRRIMAVAVMHIG